MIVLDDYGNVLAPDTCVTLDQTVCRNDAVCSNTSCLCWPGFIGMDCSTRRFTPTRDVAFYTLCLL